MTLPNSQNPQDSDGEEQGSVDKALAGDFDFDIGNMLTEAWEKTDGVKLDFNIALSVYGVAYLFFVLAVPYTLSGFTLEFTASANLIGTVLNLVCYVVIPLWRAS